MYWKRGAKRKILSTNRAGLRKLRARALLLVFEKFTSAYLFQIALEIMWLPIQIKELWLLALDMAKKNIWGFK